ncbi:MAG: thiamine pyrophosphate-binding protein, partial [Proteobacteria bacterium]|nr:thiamine pyrophosphate-binding protein [Pseudomonadota bacterium]
MSEIYGGHLVAKYLKEVEDVGAVFSLSGGHIDRIYDGFLEFGVRLIDVRHEQTAAMMAHAWSVYTGQPGVCLFTAGPGFTNSLTGVINACLENAPMVVLAGTSPQRDRGKGALQEMPQAEMLKNFVKWHDVCHDPARIPECLATAFRQAVSGKPGPVFLELPPDVLNVKVDEDDVPLPDKGGRPYRPGPDPALVRAAGDLINAAEKPLILGGSGVALSDCDADLRQFIDTVGAPFMLIGIGRGAVPDEHPLSLWDGGLFGLLMGMGQSDLVIALGIRFNWLLQFGQFFPQAKMVRVDIDPAEIDRNRRADVGLVGDLGLTLAELNRVVTKKDHTAWRQDLTEGYEPFVAAEVAARQEPSDPIHPARMVAQVREVVGDDAVYVIDGGDTSYFGLVGLSATRRSSVYSAAGGQFGCLGTGIPFALAAKAARPDETVVVISGDGSMGFN